MKPTERLKQLVGLVEGLNDKAAYVGVLGEIRQDKDGSPINMAELAAVHEFGSADGKIPERSFLRRAIEENKDDHKKLVASLLRQAVRSNASIEQVYGTVAEKAAGDVKSLIYSGSVTPALKPETVAKKGSATVLLDTGQLGQAIIGEVRNDTD